MSVRDRLIFSRVHKVSRHDAVIAGQQYVYRQSSLDEARRAESPESRALSARHARAWHHSMLRQLGILPVKP